MNTHTAHHLTLPTRIDTSSIQDVHQHWLSTIPSGVDVIIDASALSSLYTAAAQLLVSLAASLAETGHSLTITHCTESLREDIAHLGLTDFLTEHTHA